jgi:hypothetical protein
MPLQFLPLVFVSIFCPWLLPFMMPPSPGKDRFDE